MRDPDRRPLVAANWKMHLVCDEAEAYCRTLLAGLRDSAPNADVMLFPSHPLLRTVAGELAGSSVACGGQDVHPEAEGAFTGDVSARQLFDAGCAGVLCGHSERRRDHLESDELVGRKVSQASATGLLPLLCVGETLEERRRGETLEVIRRQLRAALASRPADVVLAYEPVWAIGSGETATAATAEEAHAALRLELAGLLGERQAAGTRILYGGSVKPGNAASLAEAGDVDGFLVGGASLDAASFLAIIRVFGGA